jgi:cyclophilin family peptidyl-prolyl cis-trans isomerase
MKYVIIVGILIVIAVAAFLLFNAQRGDEPQNNLQTPESELPINIMQEQNQEEVTTYDTNRTVVLKTNHGDITIELFLTKAPITAGNFLKLAEADFYNGVKFHRVIPGFMIQGGDPNTRNGNRNLYGTGGPGYTIPDEFILGLSNVTGTISMANAGPNTGGSQFFINTVDNTDLDGRHAVFGRVVEGMDVVRAIERVRVGERDIPVEPVIIQSVEVLPEETER